MGLCESDHFLHMDTDRKIVMKLSINPKSFQLHPNKSSPSTDETFKNTTVIWLFNIHKLYGSCQNPVVDVLITKRSSHKTDYPDRTVGPIEPLQLKNYYVTNIERGNYYEHENVLLYDAHKLQKVTQKLQKWGWWGSRKVGVMNNVTTWV